MRWGEDIKRDVDLDDITDGRPTVVALHTVSLILKYNPIKDDMV